MHAYQHERPVPQPKRTNLALSIIARHPGLVAGALLSLSLMSAVVANAVWYQSGAHPSPMFSTRTLKAPAALTAEQKRADPGSVSAAQVASAASPEVLREVQSALAVRGYYGGRVDGKFGSRTKNAIVSFQRDHSLRQDGAPSVRLLSQILLSASATPQEVPVPGTKVAAVETTRVETTRIRSSNGTNRPSDLVARIQAGLKSYGYEELAVDGKPGRKTRSAIQSFQLDYGMKITGEASQAVLDKLKEIGALRQG